MRKLNYSLKELVLADLYRYEGKTDTKSFLHAYATYEGFKFSVWLRMCSVARKKKLTKIFILPICRMIYVFLFVALIQVVLIKTSPRKRKVVRG